MTRRTTHRIWSLVARSARRVKIVDNAQRERVGRETSRKRWCTPGTCRVEQCGGPERKNRAVEERRGWEEDGETSHFPAILYTPRARRTPAMRRTDYLASTQPCATCEQSSERDRWTAARQGASTLEASVLHTKTRTFREQRVPVSRGIHSRLMGVSKGGQGPSRARSSSPSGNVLGATSRRDLRSLCRFCVFRGLQCRGDGGTVCHSAYAVCSGPDPARCGLHSRPRHV